MGQTLRKFNLIEDLSGEWTDQVSCLFILFSYLQSVKK